VNPRDLLSLLVVGAIVVIGGFAAADAIRGKPRVEPSSTGSLGTQTSLNQPPEPQPPREAPRGWPQGLLRGTLTFTDAKSCDIRVIGLAGGRELRVAHFASDCFLWTPPVGARVAFGLGPSSADGLHPFRIADLANPSLELGGYRALFGVVLWTADGQRVAWCGRIRIGFDLEIGGPAHRLPQCPAAYTPENRIAYAVADRVLVGDRTVFKADGGVTYVHFGTDGSLVVVIDGNRIERVSKGAPLKTIKLPAELQGKTPILRADNCGALFRAGNGLIRLLDLGCTPGVPTRWLDGNDAAWSPDGAWVALAQAKRIVFDRVVGSRLEVSWPAQAAELAWRPE
jgi:hypothetical protein